MADIDPKKPKRRQVGAWRLLERHHVKLIFIALLVSLLVHLFSAFELSRVADHSAHLPKPPKSGSIKFKVVQVPKKPKEKEKKKAEEEPPMPENIPKILEMPQAKTLPPEKADYVGTVDHTAKKETRVSDKKPREKAKDAGEKGKPTPEAPMAQQQPEQLKPQKSDKQSDNKEKPKQKVGRVAMDSYSPKPRNDYEALLPTSVNDLPGQVNAGYQDYVDDKVQEGDRIDINTTEYRYIGYFTNMRKAIELVWNYPIEAARRGMQGEVGLEFAITKDGHVNHIRVIKSSGYPALDDAIIEAIKLASPFAPLPQGFKKNRLVVTGAFRYILSSYGSH